MLVQNQTDRDVRENQPVPIKEIFLEFSIIKYYSNRSLVLYGRIHHHDQEIIHVQSRQVSKSMQTSARRLHPGMDDAPGRPVFAGISRDPC
jgi:galactokinase/mevalonate kinase-like predicted kinase